MGVDLSGNSIQSSHVIKCCGGCGGQRKPSGQREWFLLAWPLQDSSNIRAVTSNTTQVSQWKFLLCHGQHIKIKKFLKLSAAQRLCTSAFQTLQPLEKLPHSQPPSLMPQPCSLWLDAQLRFQLKEQRQESRSDFSILMSPQGITWSTWLLVQEAWNSGKKALRGQPWGRNGQVWTSQAQASSTSGQEGPGSYPP